MTTQKQENECRRDQLESPECGRIQPRNQPRSKIEKCLSKMLAVQSRTVAANDKCFKSARGLILARRKKSGSILVAGF